MMPSLNWNDCQVYKLSSIIRSADVYSEGKLKWTNLSHKGVFAGQMRFYLRILVSGRWNR